MLLGQSHTVSAQWSGTTNIYYNSGTVSIGTSTSGNPLDVYSNQNAVVRLIGVNNPSSGTSAQAAFSFYEGTVEKAKISVNSSGATGYVGGANAFQIWNFQNSPIVFATNSSERLRIDGSGNVGIGISPASGYKLDVNGHTNITGNLNVTGNFAAKYQDVAEWVPSSEQLAASTVVVLDVTKSNQVVRSTESYDTRVAGVISKQPGIALGEGGKGKVLVATTGRVLVKVDATNSPIHIGDLLVTSEVPGVAMKSEPIKVGGRLMHMPGTLIGKALEPLEKGSTPSTVIVSWMAVAPYRERSITTRQPTATSRRTSSMTRWAVLTGPAILTTQAAPALRSTRTASGPQAVSIIWDALPW